MKQSYKNKNKIVLTIESKSSLLVSFELCMYIDNSNWTVCKTQMKAKKSPFSI